MTQFITDIARKAALNAVHSHIKRKEGVLIVGGYGSGKTELLKQIKAPSASRIYRPRGTVDQLLQKIIDPKAKVSKSKARDRVDLEDAICANPKTIIVDEMDDMTKAMLPSIKAMMDAGCPVIMAGKPDFLKFLRTYHGDIKSRLTVIHLQILSSMEMRTLAKEFTDDAFTAIYNSHDNMREMMKVMQNCRDFATANKLEKIDTDIVAQFLDDDEIGV